MNTSLTKRGLHPEPDQPVAGEPAATGPFAPRSGEKSHGKARSGEKGYILISVMLLMTIMIIAMSIEIPRIAQQVKRQKEEELVFRGKAYAMAIKRFYHKTGTYPNSLQQLENTNNLRFLRKRYKDPITGDDEWHLVRVGEAQIKIPPPTGLPGSGLTGSGLTPSATPTPAPGAGAVTPTGQAGLNAPNQVNASGQLGTLNTSNPGNGQVLGGGGIMGVASNSKAEGIKEFNELSHYNEWLFVFDPRLEQSGNGITVAAPGTSGATGIPQPIANPRIGAPAR
jgi:type II secretory pathway pseudopilin PulG